MKISLRLYLTVVGLVVVVAGCGPKEQAAPQAGAGQAPATTAPTTSTTTTTMPPPPMVWRTVRWGMTKDEVLAALPGEAQKLARPADFGPGTPGSTEMAIPAYDEEGMKYRVLFGFAANGLDRIHLSATKPGDSSCRDLEERLTAKYAAPAARNDTGTSLRGQEIVWKLPDQMITLACSGVAALGFHSVTLVLTPPK